MSECPACAEPVEVADERCRWCGERIGASDEAPSAGFGSDSLLVAVVCVLVTAALIGWALL